MERVFVTELAGDPARAGERFLPERDAELATLDAASRRAAAGAGSLTLVTGPPGIGKSSLLGAAERGAEAAGLEVLSGGGREPERGYTFGLVLQLLESRVARAKPEEHARLFSGAGRFAAPLFMDGPRDAVPEGQAFSLLHGLYRLCAGLAESQPFAVCIDDAHRADEASLRFLLYLAQRVHELPIAMVLAADPTTPPGGPELLDELFAHPTAAVVRLRPLSGQSVARQIRSLELPSASDEYCRACFEATGGNPFLLRELRRELALRADETSQEWPRAVPELVPLSVAEAVMRRLRRIGPGAAELARAVAVLGDQTETRHAAALAGLSYGDAARIADALAAAEVLHPSERLGFVHPIVRAALYAARTPGQRADAHLDAARMLHDERAPAEQVAKHLLPAQRSGAGWVVDALCAAAAHALARGAPESAARYLRRALEEPPGAGQRAQVILELGRAEAIAGEPQAVDRLREAIELIGDPGERALVALEAGRTFYAHGRQRDAARAFSKGLEDLGELEPGLRARLRWAHAAAAGKRLGTGGEEALAEEEREGAGGRVRSAHLAFEASLRGDPRESTLELARRALGDGALLEEDSSEGLAYYGAAAALTFADDLCGADAALESAVEDARERGSDLGFAMACHWRSIARLRAGRLEHAAADARNAVAARRYGWRLGLPAAHAVLAEILIESDDLEGAAREIALGADPGSGVDDFAWAFHQATRAHLFLLEGDAREARSAYLECGRRQEALGATNPAMVPWRSGAALAMAQLGEIEQARTLVEEELRLARSFGAPRAIGRALHARGMIEGNGKGLRSLGEAVDTLARSEATLDHARALVDLGAALRRAGRRRDARDPLRQGLDLAKRCGGVALVERAYEELATAGARPRREALTGLESLTARERQVAVLAAQGIPNRRIAETLFITVKTVEWHLSHSYEKLGLSSRQELRAALGEAMASPSAAD